VTGTVHAFAARARSQPHPARAELLRIRNLSVAFATRRGVVRAVEGLDLDVRAGERVAIVGESGSGKSVTSRAILGLHSLNSTVTGSIRLGDRELLGMDDRQLSAVRGKEVGLILQNPTTALDPLKTIGWQIAMPLRMHIGLGREEAYRAALDLLRQVRISDPEQRMRQYPHELSGGMCQRVVIASVIGTRPALVIADEPTSSLDATTAAGILKLLRDLSEQFNIATLLISHDLGSVAAFAEKVSVMYSGRVIETARADELFDAPKHPYTRGLLESVPGRWPSKPIPGAIPDPLDRPPGCAFAPRCAHAVEACSAGAPALLDFGGSEPHLVACRRAAELETGASWRSRTARRPSSPATAGKSDPVLAAEALHKSFAIGRSWRGARQVEVVENVSFEIARGEVLALVGESGSGKTTIARMLLGVEQPTSGAVRIGATTGATGERRRRVQVVFQNPDSSLDPRLPVGRIISEPLDIENVGTEAERRKRVETLLEEVGLSVRHASRLPHELSGGQRQRVAIARALAGQPDLLILDEPVTGLDVSVQAQVLQLLEELKARQEISYLLISHDLAVVRQIADRIMVMYLGRLVEISATEDFFRSPKHPYSLALLEATSLPGRGAGKLDRTFDIGPPADLLSAPPGCRFHPRCPQAKPTCSQQSPALQPSMAGLVACHFPLAQTRGG
jgi:peptide/nickel transport system ATP-binding protein